MPDLTGFALRLGALALNPFPKAMLKPSHSKRCRDNRASPNRAKRLDCDAFTAAFHLHAAIAENVAPSDRPLQKLRVEG